MSFLSTLFLVAACLAGFGGFVWSTWTHFQDTGERPVGAWLIFVLTPLGVLATVYIVLTQPIYDFLLLGLGLYAVALGLLWWAIVETKDARLPMAFSGDTPAQLLSRGPYSLVRHPFYSSCLLYWLAGAVATGSLLLFAFFVGMTCLYLRAALLEEATFARSFFAHEYRAYAARTGMFVPWLLP
ncbi:methyltransferase family protein [Microvirga terricola]|uniref:Isoprenylcysteine carboxylmethyltransferase family protein n=1 Tax=Microvirga terricola TaxID=2719797 RepID=A0ABX0VE63_9HYPH|nr:isoprenylcysteine carboxylmethyltransferase family protein [Microvirga terricola]NIX76621.1 isoprenylcysteine carboxylmethyltransferase family protein [Microvirga terricola]